MLLENHYGLNACVSPKFISWSPTPWCGGIWRWGLKKITKFKWGHKNGAPVMGLSFWEEQKTRALSLCLVSTRQDGGRLWVGRGLSPATKHPGAWASNFQPSEPWEINFCSLSHPLDISCDGSLSRLRQKPQCSSQIICLKLFDMCHFKGMEKRWTIQ